MWKGVTQCGTPLSEDGIYECGRTVAASLASDGCPYEASSGLHALLSLGLIGTTEGGSVSGTIDRVAINTKAAYPETAPKEPLWCFLTELTKMQLVQSQIAAPSENNPPVPIDLLAEEIGVPKPCLDSPLVNSGLDTASTAVGRSLWGDHPVADVWSQRIAAYFRPRRVLRIYKSYSVSTSIAGERADALVKAVRAVMDGFSPEAISQLKSFTTSGQHAHPVAFFHAGLVACLTVPSLPHAPGSPKDLLELYDAVYGGDSRSPGVITSFMTALSLLLHSLLGTSIGELLVLEQAVVTVRPFSQYIPTDQLDTAASPSNPALCRMVVKLVESLVNSRLLFADPDAGFVPLTCPTISYSLFVDFHCRLDEVVVANRSFRPTKKEVICREYVIDPAILVAALKAPPAAFNSVTGDHIGMSVEALVEMTRLTAQFARDTKVESCLPQSSTPQAATNYDIPPPLPSGERFFKLTHGTPEPSWGDYFADRCACADSSGRTIAACSLFVKTAPLLFVSELLYRGLWSWAARLVQSSLEGGGLHEAPMNLFLFPHRSLTQLSTTLVALQLAPQSTPAQRAETIHHSYVTAMVSNMHLDAASGQQIDWAPSTFVYSLQAQLVNIFERDVSNPIVKGLIKPLQHGGRPSQDVSAVLESALGTFNKMLPLLTVCQSYFSSYHFPVISRVLSFLAAMVRVEGIRNKEAHCVGLPADWRWCTIASEAYVTFIAPSIRCTCAVSPSVALFDVLEELLDALSYPVAPLANTAGRMSSSASQVRQYAQLLVDALGLPTSSPNPKLWAAFPIPKFVDSEFLCAPYDSSVNGPGRRYPHDTVQTKEVTALLNQSMRRVTSDNVHQHVLTLRKVLFSDPILFIRKLISLAVGNADTELIFCQAQLLQGAPKAILRMFVVLAIEAMQMHSDNDKPGAEQRVGLIGALIAFVWAQNSHSFVESGQLLLRTVAETLQREAKSSATFAVELLRSLLLHMLHEPLEAEEQYTPQQLVALGALPTSRWFAQNGADSFLQNKWFDPQTMLLKMKRSEGATQADEAMAFSYMSSVHSPKSNLSAANESQFSFRNFVFAASFTPLTLHQCRLGFCEALGAALDPCVRDVSVGAFIIQRLSTWHARSFDWYADLSGTVEDVMRISARHTSCFLDLVLSLTQLSCVGLRSGANLDLPIVDLGRLRDGLPQVAARCQLVLQEFGQSQPSAAATPVDVCWQLCGPDVIYPKSAYYYAIQQVHRFLRQAITGNAGSPPTSKNEDRGISIAEVATLEEEALRDYLQEMAEEAGKRRRQLFRDQLNARDAEDKVEHGDDSDEEESGGKAGHTAKDLIMAATWLRIEQKVIARYLLGVRDEVVREATAHAERGFAARNSVVAEIVNLVSCGTDSEITAFCHDALVPRVLMSSADGVIVGTLLQEVWARMSQSCGMGKSATVARLQREAAASNFVRLLNTFVTELVVFLPSFTDAEAKRAGLALQRVLTLCREVSSNHDMWKEPVPTGQLASLLGAAPTETVGSCLPLSLEVFLSQSFVQLLRECDMSSQTANAAQGSGYFLIVRNAFIVLDRIKVTLPAVAGGKGDALFPTAQSCIAPLAEAVRLHAHSKSASFAAASALASLYDSRTKPGHKRQRMEDVTDLWV